MRATQALRIPWAENETSAGYGFIAGGGLCRQLRGKRVGDAWMRTQPELPGAVPVLPLRNSMPQCRNLCP